MKVLLILGTVAGLLSTVAFAECLAPPGPGAPPSGASATREQMLSAQAAVQEYNAAVIAYTGCIRRTKGDEGDLVIAVDALEKVADRFNVELHVFKQRNSAQ